MNKQFPSIENIFKNRKLPVYIFLILLGFYVISLVIAKGMDFNYETSWMIGGTQLLLYVLVHAICSLFVDKYQIYLNQIIFFYILNFILILISIYIIEGKEAFNYGNILPIFAALVVSFIITTILTLLIRTIMRYLKE